MINKLQLLGRIGKDPESSTTKTGTTVVNFSVATAQSWKHKETGERTTETTWHRLVFFGPMAEVIVKHAKKGMLVYIEGRLKNDEWTDKKTGDKRTGTSIMGTSFQIVDWNKDKVPSKSIHMTSSIPPIESQDDIQF